jgi:hypothetical protein
MGQRAELQKLSEGVFHVMPGGWEEANATGEKHLTAGFTLGIICDCRPKIEMNEREVLVIHRRERPDHGL